MTLGLRLLATAGILLVTAGLLVALQFPETPATITIRVAVAMTVAAVCCALVGVWVP